MEWPVHWVSLAPPSVDAGDAGKGGKDKGKKAGGKDKGKEQVAEEEWFTSPGLPPATFLALNIGDYASHTKSTSELEIQQAFEEQYKALQSESTDARDDSKDSTTPPKTPPSGQTVTFIDVDKNRVLTALEGLTITFSIHADMVSEQKQQEEEEIQVSKSRPVSKGVGSRASWDASNVVQQKVLPSDTVLLIQEVRFDSQTPLVFILELKETSLLPIVSKSFIIPKERITSSTTKMYFWLRLFTKSSVYISVYSPVQSVLGCAETVWPHNSFVQTGEVRDTPDDTDQLVFRLPLKEAPIDAATTVFAPALSETSTDANGDMLSTSRSDVDISLAKKCMVFLSIGDHLIESQTRLLLVHTKAGVSGNAEELMETQGALMDLKPDQMLVGLVRPEETMQVPKFNWKLVVLSFVPLVVPDRPIQEAGVSQRYLGKYVANRHYRLFRDVFVFEKSSFPLAFKLSVALPTPLTVTPAAIAEGSEEKKGGGATSGEETSLVGTPERGRFPSTSSSAIPTF
ncbi:hypothetical protein EON64_17695, partial [archaeon]